MTIVRSGGGYKVVSERSGRNLGGPYPSKAAAAKRLRQVEYFKHKGATKKSARGSGPFSNSEMQMGHKKLQTKLVTPLIPPTSMISQVRRIQNRKYGTVGDRP